MLSSVACSGGSHTGRVWQDAKSYEAKVFVVASFGVPAVVSFGVVLLVCFRRFLFLGGVFVSFSLSCLWVWCGALLCCVPWRVLYASVLFCRSVYDVV